MIRISILLMKKKKAPPYAGWRTGTERLRCGWFSSAIRVVATPQLFLVALAPRRAVRSGRCKRPLPTLTTSVGDREHQDDDICFDDDETCVRGAVGDREFGAVRRARCFAQSGEERLELTSERRCSVFECSLERVPEEFEDDG